MGAWGCATVREFMGFMADAKIVAPKGQLFLTLLRRTEANAWEQVYLDARRNPGRANPATVGEGQELSARRKGV